ncbi:cytochrome p450 domain-containing protein [Phthorimaea operculella]|nr:cytochrome p450 domain-containing protein [Phthorimaea operculella]
MIVRCSKHLKKCASINFMCHKKLFGTTRITHDTKSGASALSSPRSLESSEKTMVPSGDITGELFPTATTPNSLSMVMAREPIVLPFDEVPGPSSLKLLARARHYVGQTGTQLTAGALTLGINLGAYIANRKQTRILSSLFDTYGSVVRFVSPVGGDIVLINHPHHIQQVFAAEGEQPVRSILDSLQKFRKDERSSAVSGLYNLHGEEWARQRKLIYEPLHSSLAKNMSTLEQVCDTFVEKIDLSRNCHDELNSNLYNEIHKWAFDCLGSLTFSKKFTMLNTDTVYSQCDMSWLYHGLEKSTEAILKCESGFQMWKIFPTFAWMSLVKHCNILDNLIGKYVMEVEQKLANLSVDDDDWFVKEESKDASLIHALLAAEEKLTPEDICTVVMDMLLLGVNTVSSAMSFMTYFLAKHQKVQRKLHLEIEKAAQEIKSGDNIASIKEKTPYLQACIKETLRLVPPIPILTRILPKNTILDKYNIPRGTLIIISTQDAALKESNFDDADRFHPERWLSIDAKYYNGFASIPFGFGSRKCLGQNVAETMLTILTYKLLQKFKLEYHYGDIQPTNTFIVKPNKPLKIRFIDRI